MAADPDGFRLLFQHVAREPEFRSEPRGGSDAVGAHAVWRPWATTLLGCSVRTRLAAAVRTDALATSTPQRSTRLRQGPPLDSKRGISSTGLDQACQECAQLNEVGVAERACGVLLPGAQCVENA